MQACEQIEVYRDTKKTQHLACPGAGFVLLYFASLLSWPKTFMLGLLVTEMALNVAYAAHAALPAETYLTDVLQSDVHLWDSLM